MTPSPELPARPSAAQRLLDAALLAALALFCLRLLGSLEAARDLTLWDEADYLRRGLAMPERGLPLPEWGPLHSLLYFALSRLIPDTVALHDAVYRLLATLPTLGIYLCSRRAGAPRALSLLGASLFLVSAAPHIAPRPTLLALALLLLGLFVALGRRSFAGACVPLGLALLLASFARPELFASFLLLSALLALVLLRQAWRGERRRAALVGLGYAACALALMVLLGNPFADRSSRRLYAFCQHYALGEVARAKLDLDPWSQCDAVLRRSFGEVHSVGEAARANPAAFRTHLEDNLREYPRASLQLFLRGPSHASVLDDEQRPWTAARQEHAVLLALTLAGTLVLLARLLRPGALSRALRSPTLVRCALALGLVLLPCAGSAVLLHPREHYLVLQGVFLPLLVLALGAAAGAGPRGEEPRAASALAGALAVALLLAAPALGPAVLPAVPAQRQVVAALRTVAAAAPELRAPGTVGVLEAQGGYDVYLGHGFARVSPAQRLEGESFEAFLARRDVRLVVVEPRLTRNALLAGDAGFQAFLQEPEAFGFRTQPLAGTGMTVAVREPPTGRSSSAPVERASLPRAR